MAAKRPARKLTPGRRVQLHRALSKLGWGSRTQAWDWIRAGDVQVDGQRISDPLLWVDLERQQVMLRGQQAAFIPLTIALHKPPAIVTTRRDERGRRTVYDLLPSDLPWIFPAGRLDADSEGLLILTNDSRLSVRLTEPEHRVAKTYEVTVRGVPITEALQKLRRGIVLDDGPTRPAQVDMVAKRDGASVLRIVLMEGRNRQIRRMLAAVGHHVARLVRVGIGGYQLGDLEAGCWKQLSSQEIARLIQ